MNLLGFRNGEKPHALESLERANEFDYVWIDFVREESPDWAETLREALDVRVYDQHVIDSMNLLHPSFYDGTELYDMIIFQGLTRESTHEHFDYHPSAFFLLEKCLVSVRPASSISTVRVRERLEGGKTRIPRRPVGLLHQILSAMVDRFMELREPLAEQLEEWQEVLLDPENPFADWLTLMRQKNRLRRLERLCEGQEDAVMAWRDSTDEHVDEFLAVRINDLLEHVRRVLSHAQHLQTDIDSLVQIHFSAVAHHTNEIMRNLTVVAGIFLPLTFLAGIFGMNFEYMPELAYRYAYFIALAFMVAIGLGLYVYFRNRKWL